MQTFALIGLGKRNHLDTQRDPTCNFGGKKRKARKFLLYVKLTKAFVVSSKYVALVTHTLETAGHVYASPIRTYVSLLLTLINYEITRTFVTFPERSSGQKTVKGCKNLTEVHY